MKLGEAGFCAEYAIAQEKLTLRKPAHVPFEHMCCVANVVTARQSIERGLQLMRENGVAVADGLEGKTVFVPGALSATGSVGIQVLKNVYGAGRLIASASTAKVPLVEQLLLPPGLVDELVDYTKVKKLTDVIPAGTVDLVYNTQWGAPGTFALAKPETGVVASIASVPTPGLLREILPPLPFLAYWLAGLAQLWYAFLLRGTRVRHELISGNLDVREDLERAGELLATGRVRPIVRVVGLEDVEVIRAESQKVFTGKGGVGKLVVKFV